MKIAIIGGGISGLSTAYYIKKFSLPVSEVLLNFIFKWTKKNKFIKIVLYEASNRFGGWIDSKKTNINDETVFLEKGPRTLRLATGELKEINSIKLVCLNIFI